MRLPLAVFIVCLSAVGSLMSLLTGDSERLSVLSLLERSLRHSEVLLTITLVDAVLE